MTNPNSNCLEGMQCVNCKSYGPFRIEITTVMIVHDDGVGESVSDTEWNDESFCQCSECDNAGPVSTFREAQS